MSKKRNGTPISIFINGQKVAESLKTDIDMEDIPDVIRDDYFDDEDYLVTIADLIMNLHFSEVTKRNMTPDMWMEVIKAMVEFKRATDYDQ